VHQISDYFPYRKSPFIIALGIYRTIDGCDCRDRSWRFTDLLWLPGLYHFIEFVQGKGPYSFIGCRKYRPLYKGMERRYFYGKSREKILIASLAKSIAGIESR
jgi:hypothetical protein